MLSTFDQLGDTLSVRARGNHAFVVNSTDRNDLVIYDISDISNPVEIGSTPVDEYTIRIQGNYAYITKPRSLRVVDISDPTQPATVGLYSDISDEADSRTYTLHSPLTVSGSIAAIVGATEGHIEILSISNPSAPVVVGVFDSNSHVYDVSISGSTVYCATFDGLLSLNISDPTLPTLVSTYSQGDQWSGVCAINSTVYAMNRANEFSTLDMADPSMPTLLDSIIINVVRGEFGIYSPSSISTDGPIATICPVGRVGVIDVSDPENLSQTMLVGTFDRYITDVQVIGTTLYASTVANGVSVFDIGTEIADTPTYGTNLIFPYALTIVGDTGYARGNGIVGNRFAFATYDFSDPTNPERIGEFDTPGDVNGVAIKGTTAYIADGTNGLHIADVSDPHNPVSISNLPLLDTNGLPSSIWEVAIVDDIAYVTVPGKLFTTADERGARLVAVDISDPFAPSVLGDLPIEIGLVYNVAASGNIVCISNFGRDTSVDPLIFWTELILIYASDPTSLTILDIESHDSTSPSNVFLRGDTAVLVSGTYNGGVHTYRIVNGTDLVHADSISSRTSFITTNPNNNNALPGHLAISYSALVDDDIYYAAGGSTVGRVDISDPHNIRYMGSYPIDGNSETIAATDAYVYAAASNQGLAIIERTVCTPACPADVNHDGMLSPTDFTAWINAFNNNLPECDQNGDGACTPTDFTAWIANFNAGC